ncbi:MAG: sugar phosphate isomerase/epimerase, partial [Rikenellaceae bacterium]
MNRRDFLKKGAYATAGTLAGASVLSSMFGVTGCTPAAAAPKIVGLQLYSLRDAMGQDVPGTLKKVADMGYKNLETAGYSDGKIYGMAPLEFKKMAEDLGMQVSSAHLGRGYEAEKDAEIMEWWKVAMDAQAAV